MIYWNSFRGRGYGCKIGPRQQGPKPLRTRYVAYHQRHGVWVPAFAGTTADKIRLVLDLRRQLAAVRSELRHHLLVQPDVHARGIVGVAGVTELLRKFFARGKAGVDI